MRLDTDDPIDLSQPVCHNGPSWPDRPPPQITRDHRLEVEGANVETVHLDTHTGTHVDAPFHFDSGGETIEQRPLGAFAGPARFLDLRDRLEPRQTIGRTELGADVQRLEPGDIAVLVTGWGARRAVTTEYLKRWPYLDGEGAQALLDAGVAGVGIDTLSLGGSGGIDEGAPCHDVLLGAGKTIIEELKVPERVLDGGSYFLVAFPVLLEGCGGAWARAVAWPILGDDEAAAR